MTTYISEQIQERYFDTDSLVGAILSIKKDGKEIHWSEYGYRDREKNLPMTRDTIFRIASMTKPVVSFGMMILINKGLVSLSDPVHRFIESWKTLNCLGNVASSPHDIRPCENTMTIQDLLRHTSGLTYGMMHSNAVDAEYRKLNIPNREISSDRFLKALATLPLLFEPGTKWNYSVSTDVLGCIIEIITGSSLGEFLCTEIFEPLKMSDTSFFLKNSDSNRLAANYVISREGSPLRDDHPMTAPTFSDPIFHSGGGGLFSTIDDCDKFSQLIVNKGKLDGAALVNEKIFNSMTSDNIGHLPKLKKTSYGSLGNQDLSGHGFGLGFYILNDPGEANLAAGVGELSSFGALSTFSWIDMETNITATFLSQMRPFTAFNLWSEIRNLIYSKDANVS